MSCNYFDTILHNDRIDVSEHSCLTVVLEISSFKYPIAEHVHSIGGKTPAEKNMVTFQPCPQGLHLVGESLDLYHALDLHMLREECHEVSKEIVIINKWGKSRKAL